MENEDQLSETADLYKSMTRCNSLCDYCERTNLAKKATRQVYDSLKKNLSRKDKAIDSVNIKSGDKMID